MTKISKSIFKAYDIRGIYPKEINEKVAFLVGRAFGNFLKICSKKRKIKIAIGRDNRISSLNLAKKLKESLLTHDQIEIFDLGLCTTPMMYFSVSHFNLDGGIEITASHNPPEYNGFKMVKENSFPIGEKSGLRKIKSFVFKEKEKKFAKKGKIKRKNIIKDYLDFNLKDFNFKKFSPLKVVIDTANAVPGILIEKLSKLLPLKIYHLFPKLDGNFPNHNPDPLIKENLKFLREKVKKEKADLGVAFDGDGDRIVFVDEKGEIISGDLILALISKVILSKNPNQKILYDIRSSNIVRETILENKGIPIVSRIGHSFIKEKMRKENAIFGGELSGHYYSRDHYFCEAPFFVFFKILEILSETKKSLSHLIKPFKKYFHSGEINFRVKNKKEIMEKLKEKYKRGKLTQIDGIRIDFKDWWFLLRPSNTEPVLRLVIEAKKENILKEKEKEIKNLIFSINVA